MHTSTGLSQFGRIIVISQVQNGEKRETEYHLSDEYLIDFGSLHLLNRCSAAWNASLGNPNRIVGLKYRAALISPKITRATLSCGVSTNEIG